MGAQETRQFLNGVIRKVNKMPYQTIGELELFNSTNVWKNLSYSGADNRLVAEVRNKLSTANLNYNNKHNCRRNCLTPDMIDLSVNGLKKRFRDKQGHGGYLESNIKKIQNWFYQNYLVLLYDTHGKVIPYPIIFNMKGELRKWASGADNVFGKGIESMIDETTALFGVKTTTLPLFSSYKDDRYLSLWIKMKEYSKEQCLGILKSLKDVPQRKIS